MHPFKNDDRHWVVLPGQGRKEGVYDAWNQARDQIHKFKGGVAKKLESLDQALAYWRHFVPDREPPLRFGDGTPEGWEPGTADRLVVLVGPTGPDGQRASETWAATEAQARAVRAALDL